LKVSYFAIKLYLCSHQLRILVIGNSGSIQDGSGEACSNQTKSGKWGWQSLVTQVVSHWRLGLCSHLVPKNLAQVVFLLGTNVNKPFYHVLKPEFRYSACARV